MSNSSKKSSTATSPNLPDQALNQMKLDEREFLGTVLNDLDDAVVVIDQEGDILLANPQAIQYFFSENPVSHSISDYFDLDNVADAMQFSNLLEGLHSKVLLENGGHVTAVRKSNPSQKVEFRYKNNDSTYMTLLLIDITERIRTRCAIEYKEVLLNGILDNSKDAIIATDANGNVEVFSSTAEKMFDYCFAEMSIERVFRLFQADIQPRIRYTLYRLIAEPLTKNIILENVYCVRADGKSLPCTVMVSHAEINQRSILIYHFSEVRDFKFFIDTINDAYLSFGEDGQILEWNRAAESIFGWSKNEAQGLSFTDLKIQLDDQPVEVQNLEKALNSFYQKEIDSPELIEAAKKDGTVFPIDITLWPTSYNDTRIFNAFIKDNSLKKKHQDQLKFSAYHDSLTRLFNRFRLRKDLETELKKIKEEAKQLAVLFIDLDKFKNINDSLGHDVGDQLLQKTADRIISKVPETSLIARVGGDEFIVVFCDVTDHAEVIGCVELIMASFRDPITIGASTISITASMGLAFYPGCGTNIDDILRAADTAMYCAKKKGRNNYKIYTETLHKETTKRVDIEKSMDAGLHEKQMYLVYQPKVNLVTQKIVGFEALLRWDHPTLGTISPLDFIPIAEEIGRILEITRYVIDLLCQTISHWLREEPVYQQTPLPVSLNISAQHFNFDLVSDLLTPIRQHNIPAELVQIEITEHSLVDNFSECQQALDLLSFEGIKICIDDFGTKYSSLQYLSTLPIDILKIDRVFVMQMEEPQHQNIVKSIIGLASNLNIDTVVEGVETAEQLDLIKDFGGEVIQGFFYSPPLSVKDIMAYISRMA